MFPHLKKDEAVQACLTKQHDTYIVRNNCFNDFSALIPWNKSETEVPLQEKIKTDHSESPGAEI